MWPYPWTHVGTPSHLGHMDRVAATMPSQAHAGAAQEAPDIGQWEGQDVPLVRPSSCNVKGGIPSSRRYLPTYLSPASVCRTSEQMSAKVWNLAEIHCGRSDHKKSRFVPKRIRRDTSCNHKNSMYARQICKNGLRATRQRPEQKERSHGNPGASP